MESVMFKLLSDVPGLRLETRQKGNRRGAENAETGGEFIKTGFFSSYLIFLGGSAVALYFVGRAGFAGGKRGSILFGPHD
jgi:hypothetical protein